jgi:hypothetical protein
MLRLAHSSILILLVCGFACGRDFPRPSYVGQPTEALEVVPQPPPPARVEVVPPKPASGSVWIDGEWTWQGRTYSWRRGRWVKPPPGARFSPWTEVRGEDGAIYYAGGVWRNEQHQQVADPPALATAKSTVGPIVDPTGHDEETGHTVHEKQESLPDGGLAAEEAGPSGDAGGD